MLAFPEIDPVAIAIGPVKIHWYGLMYLFGFASVFALAIWRTKRKTYLPVKPAQMEELVFSGAVGLIIGARVGYVFFYGLGNWGQDILYPFKIWDGGMSFHGGLLGVMVAMWLFSRKIKRHFVDIMDFLVPFCPVGLFFGRIGNFIGGELYGRVTDHPWAMIFPTDPTQQPRHPSQLYEAFLEGIVLFIILMLFSNAKRPRFAVSGLFLLGYGAFRFSVEFVREPDAHIMFDLFDWMTRGQILCVPMIVGGLGLLVWAYTKEKKG